VTTTPRPLDPHVTQALDAVDAGELVRLVQELVRAPTITGSDAESAAQHHLERQFAAAGLDTDLWSIDLDELVGDADFPGTEAPRTEGWGLVGSRPGTDPDAPTVLLNGHIDVVPAGAPGDWTFGPWAGDADAGSVYGRGTCDMKAGLAAQLTAVRLLADAGVRLRGSVLLASVVSEEDGGLGSFATMRRGYTADLAVIAEPTSLAMVPATAGALTFRLTVPGLAAHASRRTRGVDVLDKYLLVHAALRRLEARRNIDPDGLMSRYDLAYPLSVGTVRAGEWPSTVPDVLIAEGRLGVALDEPVEHARGELEAAIAAVCAGDPWLSRHPVTVEWWGGQFGSGRIAGDSRAASVVSAAHATVTGGSPEVYGVPYGSDQRLLTAAGVPTVLYGPGDVSLAHSPDESVPIAELVTATRTFITLLAQVCG
jgi:acetylornithine deacetylase